MMKILKSHAFIFLGTVLQVLADPDAGPVPSPAADPGRNKGVKPVIVRPPQNILVDRGKSLRLECVAEGYPNPSISWLKDGTPFKPNGENFLLPTGAIMFYNVKSSDEGNYVCVARNSAGVARSKNATLQVAYIKEDFRTIPEDIVASVGGNAELRCEGPRGVPEPKISWEKDGRDLPIRGRIRTERGRLVITGATKADSGYYKCIASNRAGKRESVSVLLSVHEPPVFTARPPQEKNVNEGQDLELACEATGDPKPRIRWTKPIGVDSSRVGSLSTGVLYISNVQPGDEGEYVCSAENIVSEISATVTITVNRKPQFVRRPTNKTARVGSTVTIPCWADGKPKPDISWRTLDGESIFPGHVFPKDSRISVTQNGDLTIKHVQFSDQGEYVCQVYHPSGPLAMNARLRVTSRESDINPPVMRQVPSNMTVAQGDTVELKCSSSAVPVPKFTWSKQGSGDIKPGTRFIVTSSGSLKISNVQYGDAGGYECTATNKFGWSEWDARIKVVAKGSPSITPTLDASSIPTAPTAPVLVNSTASTVSVRWTPNSNVGKSKLTGYILEYYCLESEVSTWVRVDGLISSTVYTVTNMKPSSQYVFVVRARNSYGTSDPSQVSEAFSTQGVNPTSTDELSQVVVRVTSATPLSSATSGGGVGIRLQWTSSANCDFIQGFKIYLQPVSIRRSIRKTKIVPCYAGTTDISNLKPRVVYEIRIQPYKGEVTGRLSHIILASPESEGIDPTPPVLKAETEPLNGDMYGSAVFTWDSPQSILPEYITGYAVRCKDKANVVAYDVTKRVNSSVKTMTLENLPAGREYTAYVSFATTLGEGVQSQKVDFSVQAAAPTSVPPTGGLSGIMSNPGVLAGIAACVVLVIAIIVGVILYRRHNRNKKGRGLHGRGSIPMDPYTPGFSKGFTMTFADPRNGNYSDGTGSSTGNPNGNIFMQSGGRTAPSSVARNTTVSLNNGNGNVGTSLSPEMRPTAREATSFSYVADQLTSMSNIPPQFSSPNLERNPNPAMTASDFQSQLQQQQYQRQISENPTIAADEMSPQRDLIDMNTPTADNRTEYYARENDLPPPPPSPPMSQKTSLSDRTNRSRGSSRNSAERGSNHSSKGRRSRERSRGYQAIERVATDTDTGIDSPQQTPSPPRPSDLRGEHSSNSQQRGLAGYPYGAKQPSGRRRNDGIAVEYPRSGDPNLGYLGGPSEGETESEVGGMRNVRPAYIPHPEEVRNSVAASSVSMMNRYDSESSERSPSPASSIESLNMESASQVGVNAPQNMMSQRSANSAFVPIQAQSQYQGGGTPNRGGYAKPRVPKKNYKDPTGIVNGHYSSNHPPPGGQEQFVNRIHSASSSGSSYHNTADSGMSAGQGSYGHNSLNSSSSVESGPRGQMSRSRTTGSLSADNHPNQVENGQQFASVDRRQPENLDYPQPRVKYPASQQRNGPRAGNGSKSPQRKNSQDSNLSLPPRDGPAYIDYETSEHSDRQPMLPDQDFRAQDNGPMPGEESRTSFLAAKSLYGGAKPACGRQPELSDLPEVSTSDFYSDRSQ